MSTFIDIWAAKYGVPKEALDNLKYTMGLLVAPRPVSPGKRNPASEASILQAIRMDAPGHGDILLRNNSGVAVNPNGQPVRYGLGNDSARKNKIMKSGDLIGITTKIITPLDVGTTVGIFTSYEGKHEGWKYTATSREVAQVNWATFVIKHGGIAKFVTGPGDIWPST